MPASDDAVLMVVDLIRSLNEGDLERVVDLLTEDSVLRIPATDTHLVGRSAFTRRARPRPGTWTDVEVEVNTLVNCGSEMAVEAFVTGTHSGEWMTGIPEVGMLTGTGRRVTRAVCYLVGTREGKVSALTAYYDRMALVALLTAETHD
jgi:ketosteroid isomerase-like protein